MNAETSNILELINTVNFDGLRISLSEYPMLANLEIPLSPSDPRTAHPLHRICDGVFNKTYTDDEAVAMAKIFLDHGADVHWNESQIKKDSPLTAAASLHADKVGILYLDYEADPMHQGFFGGTALHWAAWCGRDVLMKRLLQEKHDINMIDLDHQSTPLVWAIDGYKEGGEVNQHHQIECVAMLLAAGADKTIRNKKGSLPIEMLTDEDTQMRQLLS